jgi:hypothetical protein
LIFHNSWRGIVECSNSANHKPRKTSPPAVASVPEYSIPHARSLDFTGGRIHGGRFHSARRLLGCSSLFLLCFSRSIATLTVAVTAGMYKSLVLGLQDDPLLLPDGDGQTSERLRE